MQGTKSNGTIIQSLSETIPRRHSSVELKTSPADGLATIFDLVRYSASTFRDLGAIGTRENLGTVLQDREVTDGSLKTKPWSLFSRGPYVFQSYLSVEKKTQDVGSGLRQLGLDAGTKIHLYGATSANWFICAHGAASQSMPFVTAYENLGIDGLSHSLRATKAKSIFVDEHLLPVLSKTLDVLGLVDLHIVICNPTVDANTTTDEQENFKKQHPNLLFLTFDQLCQLGEGFHHEPVPPGAEDLCGIFYTSGSTGIPKGVPVKQKAVIAAVAGLDSIIGRHLNTYDTFLAYLPLAHVLEFAFENACLFWGVKIGYGNPKTLFDASMYECLGDLRLLQPSFMIGVPAIWEAIKRAINSRVATSNKRQQSKFQLALEQRMLLQTSYGYTNDIGLDPRPLPQARDVVGSRLRFAMSGGGPVAKSTQEMISAAVAPLINGYGLTETMAMGGLMDPAEWRTDCIGRIPASIEMKLVDCPELGYYASSIPAHGQIYIRGASVFSGYFEDEKQSEIALTHDGWFRTGDIGQWLDKGHFKIIDRIKNLVKTLNGEYIALEKLESIYRSATLVSNVCVYASPTRSKPIVIVIPNSAAISHALTVNNDEDAAELLQEDEYLRAKKITTLLLTQLQAVGKEAGLVGMEIVQGVVVAEETEWSVANKMTTAVGKLNRAAIIEKYKTQIEAVYEMVLGTGFGF